MSTSAWLLLIPAVPLSLFAGFCGLGFGCLWAELVMHGGYKTEPFAAVYLTVATLTLLSMFPILCLAVYFANH